MATHKIAEIAQINKMIQSITHILCFQNSNIFQIHILQIKKILGTDMKQFRQIIKISILLSFIVLSLGQPVPLKIQQFVKVSLKALQHKQYIVKLTQAAKEGQNLFIEAQSPFNDPFESPIILVKYGSKSISCDDEFSSYAGVCKIQSEDLKNFNQFIFDVYCLVDCNLQIGAYIDKTFYLELNKKKEFSSFQNFGIAQTISIQVPKDLQFTSVVIIARLLTFQTAQQGISLYANYGPDPSIPSEKQYLVKGESTFGHRLIIKLTNSEIKAGQKIILYLFMGVNNTVQILSEVVISKVVALGVGTPVVTFLGDQQTKQYIANFTKYNNTIDDKDILIKFITYSGNPQFKISFDPNFNSSLVFDTWSIESSVGFLISPSMRVQNNFTGLIYINVTTTFVTSYYLVVQINNKNFIYLQNQLMQMVKLQNNTIQNFIYQDQNLVSGLKQDIVRYKATVQMITGGAQIGIRDCDSLMKSNDVSKCILTSPSDLKNPEVRSSFDNVKGDMKKYYNFYQIYFSYNVTTCPKVNQGSFKQRYICDFHVIVRSLPSAQANSSNKMYLGIQISKYNQPKILKQGITTKDSVPAEKINYYQFQLLSTQNLAKIQFFTTVLMGDISLFISRKQKYPDFENMLDQGSDVKVTVNGTYIVQGKQLSVGTYYIGVYAYEITDYTISVALQRKAKNNQSQGQSTEVQLKKGVSQYYTMAKDKQTMKFYFLSGQQQQIQVKVEAVKGTITYVVERDYPQAQKCNSYTTMQSGSKKCQFKAEQNTKYVITVNGISDQTQIFYISYKNEQTCEAYVMNVPLYMGFELSKTNDKTVKNYCYIYSMLVLDDIQVTINIPEIAKMKFKNIFKISIKFESGMQIKMDTYEKIITKQQLELLCQNTNATSEKDLSSKKSGCDFILQANLDLSNYTYSQQYEYFQVSIAIQEFDDENVLFDGVPMKIVTKNISIQEPKKFYYIVYDAQDVHDLNIYLMSETVSKYQVAVKVVDDVTYAKDTNNSAYGKFNQNSNNVKIVNSSDYSPVTLLTIKKQLIKNIPAGASANLVMIAVYAIPYTSENSPANSQTSGNQTYIFTVEVTQKSTSLAYGQTKIGYVDKDQLYQYQIQVQASIPSILTVRPLGGLTCFSSLMQTQLYIKSQGAQGKFETVTTQFKNIKAFEGVKGTYRIIIKGTHEQTCTYQISYSSISNPIKTVLKSIPYEINIQKTEDVAYFFYYNNLNDSFSVIQMLNGGNSIIYVEPLKQIDSVQALLNKNLETYRFIGQLNGNVVVNKSSLDYCTKCYYLIVVKGKPQTKGQLIISPTEAPISLKQGAIIKQKLNNGSKSTYQFYSFSTFNVTVSVIYGRVSVQVTNSDNQTITRQNISSLADIVVPVPQEYSKNSADFFDQRLKHKITVTSLKDSSFFVQIKKKLNTIKLYEGMPLTLEISNGSIVVEFSQVVKAPLNIMIQNLNYNKDPKNLLSFQCSFIPFNNETPLGNGSAISSKTQSQQTYNLQFVSKQGNYILKVISQKPTKIHITLAKKLLTHLLAARTMLVSDYSIFQIWSPGDSIMIEIFSCKNDIEVVSSSNYTKLLQESDQGVVRMQHANYGGHYVVSSENLKGEYYLQTSPFDVNQKQNPLYMVSYYLYSPGQKMPYKVYSVSSTVIQYSYNVGIIQFKLSKIYRMDHNKAIGKAIYTLYISNNTEAIQKMTKCSLGNAYKIVQVFDQQSVKSTDYGKTVVFKVNLNQISQIIGNSPNYFVGAQAVFEWEVSKPHHAKSVNFVYQISQLLVNNSPTFQNANKSQNTLFVILWIVVPFILGSFVLFLAGRYFLRSLRYRPTQLMEEDDHLQFQNQSASVDTSTDSKTKKQGQTRSVIDNSQIKTL